MKKPNRAANSSWVVTPSKPTGDNDTITILVDNPLYPSYTREEMTKRLSPEMQALLVERKATALDPVADQLYSSDN